MENIGRREFIGAFLKGALTLPFLSRDDALAKSSSVEVVLPPIPFQKSYMRGDKKGGRILIVGGIHGNEPGAYKAAEILRSVKVKRGELIIAPRANFLSILANVRGYNGDMNRKFRRISKRDPDYPYVEALKELIRETKPQLLLTLHDGFGFHSVNPKAWGQCLVIDSERYKNFRLGNLARKVAGEVNRKIKNRKWRFPVFNTKTFEHNTRHPEQRKSLTYYSLTECGVPAICLEVSKQLPNLESKVRFHLLLLKEFFKVYNVEIEPDFDYLIENISSFLMPKKLYSAELSVNGRMLTVSFSKTFKLPPGSRVELLKFSGGDGVNVISPDVNMNLRKFSIKRRIALEVREDFRKLFRIRIVVG